MRGPKLTAIAPLMMATLLAGCNGTEPPPTRAAPGRDADRSSPAMPPATMPDEVNRLMIDETGRLIGVVFSSVSGEDCELRDGASTIGGKDGGRPNSPTTDRRRQHRIPAGEGAANDSAERK